MAFFLGVLAGTVNFNFYRMEDMKYEDNVCSAVEKIGEERGLLRSRSV